MGVRTDKVQVNVKIGGKEAGQTLGELQKEARQLYRELKQLTPGTEAFKKKLDELKQSKSTIKQVSKEINNTGKAAQGLKGGLQKAGAALAVLFTVIVTKAADWARQLGGLAVAMEGAGKKATTVFGEALPIVEDFARKYHKSLGLTREQTVGLATDLADLHKPLGFTAEESAKISTEYLSAAAALSEWSGGTKTAAEVMELFGKASQGETEGLKALGISIKQSDISARLAAKGQAELTGALLDQAKALAVQELIMEKSQDAQNQYANTTGSLQRKLGETTAFFMGMAESIAKRLTPAMHEALDAGAKLFGWISGMVDLKYSEELQQEQAQLNALVGSITQANDNQEVRNRLIGELQAKYPGFLKDLETETMTNEQLRDRLGEVNDEYTRKITIAAQEELVTDALEQQKRALIDQTEAQKKLNLLIQKANKEYDFQIDTTQSLAKQLLDFQDASLNAIGDDNAIERTARGFSELFRGGIQTDISEFNQVLSEYTGAQFSYMEGQDNLSKQSAEFSQVLKDMGLNTEDVEQVMGRAGAATEEFAQKFTNSAAAGEEYQRSVDNARKNLEDLKIALIDDPFEKKAAEIRLQTQRKIESLVGSPEQVAEQAALLEEAMDGALAALQEKRAAAEVALDEERAIRAEEQLQQKLEQMAIAEEMEMLALQEKFSKVLDSEMAAEEALFNLKQSALKQRLSLLKSSGKAESVTAKQVQKEMLKNQIGFNKESVNQQKRSAALKNNVEQEAFGAASDLLQMGVDLLSSTEKSRKKHATAIKAFTISQIWVDFAREVAGYFAQPANATSFGVLGAIQMGIAGARAAAATVMVARQKFEKGGFFKYSSLPGLAMRSSRAVPGYELGGISRGARHSQGGVAMVDSITGQKVGEMEGGEPYMILSRNTYANNREVVDQLLHTTLYRNGAPIYEEGGVFEGPAGSTAGSAPEVPEAGSGQDIGLLLDTMMGIRSDLQQFSGSLRAYISYDDLNEALDVDAELSSDAGLN